MGKFHLNAGFRASGANPISCPKKKNRCNIDCLRCRRLLCMQMKPDSWQGDVETPPSWRVTSRTDGDGVVCLRQRIVSKSWWRHWWWRHRVVGGGVDCRGVGRMFRLRRRVYLCRSTRCRGQHQPFHAIWQWQVKLCCIYNIYIYIYIYMVDQKTGLFWDL